MWKAFKKHPLAGITLLLTLGFVALASCEEMNKNGTTDRIKDTGGDILRTVLILGGIALAIWFVFAVIGASGGGGAGRGPDGETELRNAQDELHLALEDVRRQGEADRRAVEQRVGALVQQTSERLQHEYRTRHKQWK